MATVRRTIHRPPDAVFAALTTPETYPHWLVGCREIRSVDADWPEPGQSFHHRVGLVGPITVADTTEVVEIESPRRLSLEVRARPVGRGRATFTLEPAPATGGPPATLLALEEAPIGLLAPTKPLADLLTAHRNQRSLANLADYLERDPAVT